MEIEHQDLFSLNVGPGRGINAVCDLEHLALDAPQGAYLL